MPTAAELIQDPRYQALSWEDKQSSLERLAERQPSATAPLAIEFERLRHFSKEGNVPDRKLNGALLEARERWYSSIANGGDPKVADAKFDEDRSRAAQVRKDDAFRRDEDMNYARELLDFEEITKVSAGNILADVLHEIHPGTRYLRLTGQETAKDIDDTLARDSQKEINRILRERGHDDASIEVLKRDATLATGAAEGTPADVDSQGDIAINDGALVRDIESVRTAIGDLGTPASLKRSMLATLDRRRRRVIDKTFHDIVAAGGARYHVDSDGNAGEPTLSPIVNLKTVIPETFSLATSPLTGSSSTERRAQAASSAEANSAIAGEENAFLEIDFGWDFQVRERAVLDLLERRDDWLDRARVGLGTGLLNDTANMIFTPFEMAGADWAKDIATTNKASDDAFRGADRLNEISDTADFVELAARILPQVLLTRGVGGAAGGVAKARGAAQATQTKVSTLFATGFGGLQSATFNARDVLDNEGSSQEALAAGILGFGTTFLLANGFNKIGYGGVEDFRRTASSSANAAKSQLSQRMRNIGRGAVGEGVEEFIDEFINGLITQDFTGASSDELAANAFKAAIIGGGFGGAFGARRKISDITLDTPDSELGAAADPAMQESGKTSSSPLTDAESARLSDLRLKGNEDTLTDEEVVELESLENTLAQEVDGTATPNPIQSPRLKLTGFNPSELSAIDEEIQELDVRIASLENQAELSETEQDELDRARFMRQGKVNLLQDNMSQEADGTGALNPRITKVSDTEYRVKTLTGEATISVTDPQAALEAAIQLAETTDQLLSESNAEVDLDQNTDQVVEKEEDLGRADIKRRVAAARKSAEDVEVENAELTEDEQSDIELELAEATANTAADQVVEEEVAEVVEEGAPTTSTPRSYAELKNDATVINDKIKVNRQRGLYPELANVEPVRLNSSKATLAEFIEQNSNVEEGAAPVESTGSKLEVVEEEVISEPTDSFIDEDIDTAKDSLFDTLNTIESGRLTEEQEAEYDQRIDKATTTAELTAIENELLQAAIDPALESTSVISDDPVAKFLSTATRFQKQEYMRRFAEEKEDSLEVIEDLKNQDNPELLSDEDILRDLDERDLRAYKEAEENGGDPSMRLYGGFSPLDPALWTQTAKSVYKGIKALPAFVNRMVEILGEAIRPFARRVFHDLRRNNGKIREANPEIVLESERLPVDEATPEEEFDLEEAEAQRKIDEALTEDFEDATPSDRRMKLPPLLPRSLIDRFTKIADGVNNSFIPGLGGAFKYLSFGMTYQRATDIVGQFFEAPLKSWMFGREAARSRGKYIVQQFKDQHAVPLKTDSNNALVNSNPKRSDLSTRISDVIEDVMENGTTNYDVDTDFLKMVADWKYVRNRVLKDAKDEGIDLNFLKDADGKYDNSKIIDNFYFPRGIVSLVGGGAGRGGAGGGRPRATVRSFSNSRKIDSEQEGVETEKYRYDSDPFQRMQEFIEDVYGRIEDRRLATHPDIVAAGEKSKFVIDKETGKKKKVVSLGKGTLNLAGKSYPMSNENVSTLNRIIDGHSVNPDGALKKVSSIFQVVRAAKFTFDASVASIQLAYLGGGNPIRFAKTLAISLADTLGKKSYMQSYNINNQALGAEMVSVGGNFNLSIADVEFLNETDSTSGRLRQLLAKTLSPFTNFHTVATQIGVTELYASLRYQALDPKTQRLDPEKAAKIVKFAERAAGRESLTRNGLSGDHRSILSTVSSAPGMYAAFINMMSDVTSKDPFVRKMALKSHSRFIVGASMMFLAKTFGAMMLDDDDKRSDEVKLKDALSRLNPASKKFMTTEVSIGEGRKAIIAEGGFFRTATQLVARLGTDPKNADAHLKRFLKSKKSPGIGTALESLTNEDYFGNEITTLESVSSALLPVTIDTLAMEYKGPVLDVVAQTLNLFGGNFKGQSMTSLLREKKHLGQTLEEVIFSGLGFSSYTESSRAEYNRIIDQQSQIKYGGDKYRDLTANQKASIIKEANDKGLLKPKIKTPTSYMDFKLKQLDKNLSDPATRELLADKGIYGKVAAIPLHSSEVDGVMVPIESTDHKKMYRGFIEELKKSAANSERTSEAVLKEAAELWQHQLRANGY